MKSVRIDPNTTERLGLALSSTCIPQSRGTQAGEPPCAPGLDSSLLLQNGAGSNQTSLLQGTVRLRDRCPKNTLLGL